VLNNAAAAKDWSAQTAALRIAQNGLTAAALYGPSST
jgi:hypothetical protein